MNKKYFLYHVFLPIYFLLSLYVFHIFVALFVSAKSLFFFSFHFLWSVFKSFSSFSHIILLIFFYILVSRIQTWFCFLICYFRFIFFSFLLPAIGLGLVLPILCEPLYVLVSIEKFGAADWKLVSACFLSPLNGSLGTTAAAVVPTHCLMWA